MEITFSNYAHNPVHGDCLRLYSDRSDLIPDVRIQALYRRWREPTWIVEIHILIFFYYVPSKGRSLRDGWKHCNQTNARILLFLHLWICDSHTDMKDALQRSRTRVSKTSWSLQHKSSSSAATIESANTLGKNDKEPDNCRLTKYRQQSYTSEPPEAQTWQFVTLLLSWRPVTSPLLCSYPF